MRQGCSCPSRPEDVFYGGYRVPWPAACDVEDARFHHGDLATLDEISLTAELLAITGALARLRPRQRVLPGEWLRERHERVRAALRLRTVRAETAP
jgi:hypothetical protein